MSAPNSKNHTTKERDRINNTLSIKYSQETLLLVIKKCPTSYKIQIGIRDENGSIETDLDYYDDSEYETISSDTYRNHFFQEAIDKASDLFTTWLEIGPGSSGCLTKMVLNYPENKVTAIEASTQAHRKFRENAKRFIRQNRLTTIKGYAGHIDIPGSHEVLLSEILGHISSSEGFCEVLRKCGIRYPPFKCIIPSFFGTVIVPVDLSKAKYLLPTMVGEKTILFYAYPFSETRITGKADVQLMEFYSSSEVTKRGLNVEPYTRDLTFVVTKPSVFYGFASYIVYGQTSDPTKWCTSLQNPKNTENNWSTIFIPFTPIQVIKNDIIRCNVKCDVLRPEPVYQFQTTVIRNSNTLTSLEYEITYHDIYTIIMNDTDHTTVVHKIPNQVH
jgi:hypothetical protein